MGTTKFKLWMGLVFLAALVGGGFCAWRIWGDPESRRERAMVKDYEGYEAAIKEYRSKEAVDTYGGKTPEQTIEMFVKALEEGNIDLASKYFALEKNDRSPDYMTRRAAEKVLAEAKQDGRLPLIISTLRKMRPANHKTASNNTVDYISLGQDGMAEHSMTLEYSETSGIWKIESL